MLRAQDDTFHVGDKWKDPCPTPHSRIGTIFQTERCQRYFSRVVIPCSAKASRGQAVHASVVWQEWETCAASQPMTTCERLLLFIPSLKACNQHQKQQAGLRVPKAACQPSPISAGLHCHCIAITETMNKVCFTDIRF